MDKKTTSAIATVPGLHYLPDGLNDEEQEQLLAIIDRRPWLTDLKRRVQHYGYRYDYKRRTVDRSMFLGPLPHWAIELGKRFVKEGWAPRLPDQLIINGYLPGQGIASHIDCIPASVIPFLGSALEPPV
jgi:alkylated DNA repair dioxygenase AlkB